MSALLLLLGTITPTTPAPAPEATPSIGNLVERCEVHDDGSLGPLVRVKVAGTDADLVLPPAGAGVWADYEIANNQPYLYRFGSMGANGTVTWSLLTG